MYKNIKRRFVLNLFTKCHLSVQLLEMRDLHAEAFLLSKLRDYSDFFIYSTSVEGFMFRLAQYLFLESYYIQPHTSIILNMSQVYLKTTYNSQEFHLDKLEQPL